MSKAVVLAATHLAVAAAGFVAGIYVLPILTAPSAPTSSEVASAAQGAPFRGEFRRDLAGSDALHWGEGVVSVGPRAVALSGRIAPGPAYMLYLAPEFVETEEQFLRVKARAARLGDVKTFENFIVPVHESIDVARYDTVVVWCEAFAQFITAAKYR